MAIVRHHHIPDNAIAADTAEEPFVAVVAAEVDTVGAVAVAVAGETAASVAASALAGDAAVDGGKIFGMGVSFVSYLLHVAANKLTLIQKTEPA